MVCFSLGERQKRNRISANESVHKSKHLSLTETESNNAALLSSYHCLCVTLRVLSCIRGAVIIAFVGVP